MAECTKCGHDPDRQQPEPLQTLLAASMMVIRLHHLKVCCSFCSDEINDIIKNFDLDSKGSQSQSERK